MQNSDGHPVLARFLDVAMAPLRPVRQRVIPWARGRVLEIGCGTGANFGYYEAMESLTAVEPDPHMRKRSEQSQARLGLEMTLLDADAEALPFEDASFDSVVCTFVLCTIPNPERAVAEMYRVLRPDGVLVFAEHVCAGAPSVRRAQTAITPLWSRFGGGCRLNNDALQQLRDAGFTLEVRNPERASRHPFPVVYGVGSKNNA